MSTPRRLPLAQLPTPIHPLARLSREVGKQIYIWRDDLTGCVESGNKVRKLEFLLAAAMDQGCDTVVTCGGPQSNHTRATSAMCRRLGLEVIILTAAPDTFDRAGTPTGNWFLNEVFGADLRWIPQERFQQAGAVYDSLLAEVVKELRSAGKKPYVIPLGGSNEIGALGYRYGVAEMVQAWKAHSTAAPDSLFCALGSGGTFVGLQWGLQEQGLATTSLYGVNVLGSREKAEKYREGVHAAVERTYGVKLDPTRASTLHEYGGGGYAIASDEDLEFYLQLARLEGIVLDPCYTGKAFRGMLQELKQEPKKYGDRILFLHSGGILGNFAYAAQFEKVMAKRQ
jgi:D-cysteine desulfhydrase